MMPSHWFFSSLGYTYSPAQDGAISDWLMDLVSVGFSKQHRLWLQVCTLALVFEGLVKHSR